MTEEWNLIEEVSYLVDDYIGAWKRMYSTLKDLNSTEKHELLDYIQNHTKRTMYTDDYEYLLYKDGLSIQDISEALDKGIIQ